MSLESISAPVSDSHALSACVAAAINATATLAIERASNRIASDRTNEIPLSSPARPLMSVLGYPSVLDEHTPTPIY